MTDIELQAKLAEALRAPRGNLIYALQQWFELVDKAEEQSHKAFQLTWSKYGVLANPSIDEFTVPWQHFANQIHHKLLAANIIRTDTIPRVFKHNAREYFYGLKNIVFLLDSGFALTSKTKGIL